MIEVKGTRSAQAAIDPADPLGLRKPLEAGSGPVSGLLVGLLGLAVYLRSFLWAEPAQAAVQPDPAGLTGADEAGVLRSAARTHLKLADNAPKALPEPATPDEGSGSGPSLPIVFGPIDPAVLASLPHQTVPRFVQGYAANTPLPPFGKPQLIPAQDGPGGPPAIHFPGPDAGQPDLLALFAQDETGTDGPDPDVAPGDETGPVGDPRNRAPRNTGPVYLGDVGSGATLAIVLSQLLANSTDEDGDDLSVAMGRAASGLVQPHNAGWRYLADADHLGDVEISYRVTDGQRVVLQSAVLTVIENLHEGTDETDLILGTDGRDRVFAHAGDDNIATFLGRDVVFGGEGADNIAGGEGRDTLFGDAGDDVIAGGADADLIFGGDGDDQLFGEAGDDEIHGDAGDDLVDGGEGADSLTGDAGDDTVLGGDGDDLLAGGAGDDLVHGASGRDVLFGDAGADVLSGGAGGDLLFGGLDADTLDGGEGDDVLSAGDGADLVRAGSGDDAVSGGEGDDRLFGEAGSDHMAGDAGNDLLDGGDGADWLSGGDGADTVTGGGGNDVVIVDKDHAADILEGGEGFDELAAAIDSSGVAFDLIQGTVTSGVGLADEFAGFEAFVGSAESDVFLAAEGAATLTGNDGADLFAFVPGDRLAMPQSSYRITDYSSADTLTFSTELAGISMRKAQRTVEDRIEEFFEDFADRFNADEPLLRYFHEWQDDYQRTIVEVDFDHDRAIDLVVTLEGGHEFDVSPLLS
jgi:Ca2+-binding RTX toxin-like protein